MSLAMRSCILPEEFLSGLYVGIARPISTVEVAQAINAAVLLNCRTILTSCRNVRDTLNAKLIVFTYPGIEEILLLRRRTKILNLVISRVTIFMIEEALGPFTVMQCPANLGFRGAIIHSDTNTADAFLHSVGANSRRAVREHTDKFTCLRVVSKHLPQCFNCRTHLIPQQAFLGGLGTV